jgi:hypothetical protein
LLTVFSGGEAVNVKLLSDTVFQKLPDLSSYPSFTPKGCWGVRKMVSGYSGPIVRIRDTDDDSEQDVYATGQDLNAFTVVGEARVTTLYDQSGEGNHMSQPANSLQPKLVASASPGTKPGVEFNGTSEFLQTEAGTPSSPKAFMAQKPIVLFSGETALVSSDLIGVYGSLCIGCRRSRDTMRGD